MDPGKKDALLSHVTAQLDGLQSTQAADAAAEKASSVRDGLSEFLTEEPTVREGEVAWGYSLKRLHQRRGLGNAGGPFRFPKNV